jgi:hypothetical protein
MDGPPHCGCRQRRFATLVIATYPSPCIRRIFGATPHLIEPTDLALRAGALQVRRQRR